MAQSPFMGRNDPIFSKKSLNMGRKSSQFLKRPLIWTWILVSELIFGVLDLYFGFLDLYFGFSDLYLGFWTCILGFGLVL